jgi:hypothetical protein
VPSASAWNSSDYGRKLVQIRLGYEMIYNFPQPTPMILALSIHYSRASDIIIPDYLITDPAVPIRGYRDDFGNWCTRIVAPPGRITIKTDALIRDTGQPDGFFPAAQQHAVEDLPEETLVFLLGSRCCPRWLGIRSGSRSRVGRACRRSAIMPTTGSRSIISRRDPRGPLGRPSTSAPESAAITRILPLNFAVA